MNSFLQSFVDEISKGYYQFILLAAALFWFREREHYRQKAKLIQDMDDLNSRWEKALKEQNDHLSGEYQKQIKLLQDAKGVVWVRINADSEAVEMDSKSTDVFSKNVH